MITAAIEASGNTVIRTAVQRGNEIADLRGFEECLEQLKRAMNRSRS